MSVGDKGGDDDVADWKSISESQMWGDELDRLAREVRERKTKGEDIEVLCRSASSILREQAASELYGALWHSWAKHVGLTADEWSRYSK